MMTMRFKMQCASGIMLTVMVIMAVGLVALIAHGHAAGQTAAAAVAASQPASQPEVVVPVGGWFAANGGWLVPLAASLGGLLLLTLATALTRYPKLGGVVAVLRWLGGLLSGAEFRDGKRPGLVLKLPLVPPSPPPPDGPTTG